MGVTLKDMLPGLIGAGVGAISPRAGAAGAKTLEMADAFSQRRRRQSLEDERMDMSRESAQRAGQSFEYAKENHAYTSRQRADAEHERSLARNAGASMIADYEGRGIQLPEHIKAPMAMAESMEQFNQLGTQAKKFVSETPMSPEAVEKYRLGLKPGEYAYVTERQPDGSLIKRTIRGEGETGGGSSLTGLTTGLNAAQSLQRAGMTLEHAGEKYTEEGRSQFAGAREDAPGVPDQIRLDDPNAARNLLRSETTLDLGEEERGIEKAELGVQSAEQDFFAQIMKNPQILQALMQLLGGQMTQGVNTTQQGGPINTEDPNAPGGMTPAQIAAAPYRSKPKKEE